MLVKTDTLRYSRFCNESAVSHSKKLVSELLERIRPVICLLPILFLEQDFSDSLCTSGSLAANLSEKFLVLFRCYFDGVKLKLFLGSERLRKVQRFR